MSIFTTIETDLTAAWTEIETVGEETLLACWNGIKPALTSIGPVLLADAVTLAQAAVAELGAGASQGEILTNMLNAAEGLGKQAISSIESNLLSAIASIHLSAAIAATPAAAPADPAPAA